jgi:excisionase family DNA binding protein
MTETEPDRYMTVPEVAERLRLNPETIRRMLRDGRMRGFRLGADSAGWRVSERDLAAFIRSRIETMEEQR